MAVVKTSVLENEMELFSTMIDHWWDKDGPIGPLHRLPELTNKLMKNRLSKLGKINPKNNLIFSGLKILDAGCGGGINSENLARLGAEVVGIDPHKEMINLAKTHKNLDPTLTKLTYINTTVEEHALMCPETYDIVISSGVLEHIYDCDLYLEACLKCLKPGGCIFIATFNKTWLAKVMGIWVAEYVLNLVPKGSHDYDKFISPDNVSDILLKYNAVTLDTTGLFVNALTWNWYPFLSSVLYFLHAIKIKA